MASYLHWHQSKRMPAFLFRFFFFQAEDGIRDKLVTGVQTCALPIYLVTEPPLSGLGHVLPAVLLERPVWLRIRAHARVEPSVTRRERRYLRLDVREFAIGRQGLPAVLLRILLDPRTLGVLRWPLPDSIEAITVEPGRVVIRLAS